MANERKVDRETTTGAYEASSGEDHIAMAGIRGNRFLYVTRATALDITEHALDRLGRYMAYRPTRALAEQFFMRARHLRVSQLRLLGYRPAYEVRYKRGQRSIYFRFQVFGEELIAVLQEGEAPGAFVWVTTYGKTREVEQFRAIGCVSETAVAV